LNAFVTEVNSTGTSIVYSTYLGAGHATTTVANGVALGLDGSAYVVGYTTGTSFPGT
jgi:hypothetical protein